MQLTQITKVALLQAKKAQENNEVPVGAVVFGKNKIISKAHNKVIAKNDPLEHAEIIALRKASKKLKTINLMDYNLYVTLEPCTICSYIIARFKIGALYFGCYDKKNGSIENGDKVFTYSKNLYRPKIYGGIAEKESLDMLQSFFKRLRSNQEPISFL